MTTILTRNATDYTTAGKLYPDGRLLFWRSCAKTEGGSTAAHDREKLVTLSDVPNCQKSKKGIYGLNGLTSYARRTISSGAALLEKSYGKENCLFGTLTLPNYPSYCLDLLQSEWQDLIRQFFQWYSYQLESKRLESYWLYVTEIQEKRTERRIDKKPIFHCHWVGYGLLEGDYVFTADQIRDYWSDLLYNCLKKHHVRESGLPEKSKARVNLQIIKKSIGGYLAKYLSKGFKKTTEESIPSQLSVTPKHAHCWWGISKSLRDFVKKETVEFSFETSGNILDFMQDCAVSEEKVFTWNYDVWIDNNENRFRVASIYQLTKKFHEKLREELFKWWWFGYPNKQSHCMDATAHCMDATCLLKKLKPET